ncbi:MAG: hypothetical protein P8016_09300 [Sedimentisphaerales bacterium]
MERTAELPGESFKEVSLNYEIDFRQQPSFMVGCLLAGRNTHTVPKSPVCVPLFGTELPYSTPSETRCKTFS